MKDEADPKLRLLLLNENVKDPGAAHDVSQDVI